MERHLSDFPLCANEDAGFEVYDPAAEAASKMQQSAAEAAYAADVQTHLVQQYSNLHYQKLVPQSVIQNNIKEDLVEPMVNKMKEEIYRRLAHGDPAKLRSLEEQVGTVFDVHRGIYSASSERHATREMFKPVTPVKRPLIDSPDSAGRSTGPRSGDFVWDVPVKSELESMLAADPTLLEQLRAASDSWAHHHPASGQSHFVYADIPCGSAVRSHPGLGVQADRSDGR